MVLSIGRRLELRKELLSQIEYRQSRISSEERRLVLYFWAKCSMACWGRWVGGLGGLGRGERGGWNELLWVLYGWVGGWVGWTYSFFLLDLLLDLRPALARVRKNLLGGHVDERIVEELEAWERWVGGWVGGLCA